MTDILGRALVRLVTGGLCIEGKRCAIVFAPTVYQQSNQCLIRLQQDGPAVAQARNWLQRSWDGMRMNEQFGKSCCYDRGCCWKPVLVQWIYIYNILNVIHDMFKVVLEGTLLFFCVALWEQYIPCRPEVNRYQDGALDTDCQWRVIKSAHLFCQHVTSTKISHTTLQKPQSWQRCMSTSGPWGIFVRVGANEVPSNSRK